MFMGTVVGGTITVLLIRTLSPVAAALSGAIGLAVLSFACTQRFTPTFWWTAVGAIAGIIIGTGAVVAESLAESGAPLEFGVRCTIIGFQSISGFLSGALLGRKIHQAHVPTLKEFLSKLGALTAGVFAVVVTLEFILHGLEEARTLSSRLSATTTILITSSVIPGLVGYLLTERRTNT